MASLVKSWIPLVRHVTEFCEVSNISRPHLADFYCYQIKDALLKDVNKTVQGHKNMCYQFTLLTHGLEKMPDLSAHLKSDSTSLLWISTPGSILSWDIPKDLDGYVLLCSEQFLFQDMSTVKTLQKFPFLEEGSKFALPVNEHQHSVLTSLYSQILKEEQKIDSYTIEVLSLHLRTLLYQCKRIFEKQPQAPLSEKEENAQVIVNRFKKLVSVHLGFLEPGKPAKIKQVNEYAHDLNLHPNYLNEVVKKISGKSASSLIKEKTIEKSKSLLLHSDLNISQISATLGFETSSYFSTFFKKSTGYTPSEYKRLSKL